MRTEHDSARLEGATPILQVAELPAALHWYQDVLGFRIAWTWGDPPTRAAVCRDGVELNLVAEPGEQRTASRAYFSLRGVDAFHERIRRHGARLRAPIGERPYGMRDFCVVDPDGNELAFGEPVGGAAQGGAGVQRAWARPTAPGRATGARAAGAVAVGALAVGALAVGALAVGALSVGRLAVGSLAIDRSRARRLAIDELDVRQLRVGEVRVGGGSSERTPPVRYTPPARR